jgi:hypothetical protein
VDLFRCIILHLLVPVVMWFKARSSAAVLRGSRFPILVKAWVFACCFSSVLEFAASATC